MEIKNPYSGDIALVSMRTQESDTYSESRDAISTDWSHCLAAAGLLAVPVPNFAAQVPELCGALRPVLIVLTGGDISPASPQMLARETAAVFRRDETERCLVDWAIDNGVPVLGVCRGMQFLNVYFGGSVSLGGSATAEPEIAHVAERHGVDILVAKWRDAADGQERIDVNSYHEDCVIVDQLAEPLSIAALSEGGQIVEGFCHADLPVLGIQWHPERESALSNLDRKLIRFLTAPGSQDSNK